MAKVRVVCQKWMEFSPGGVPRPDGYTLHLTNDERNAYIAKYWEDLEKPTPETYSAPYGTPYPTEVDAEMAKLIKQRGFGQWRLGELPPRTGGYIYT